MTERFLSLTEVAKLIDVKVDSLRRYKLPEPDAWIGKVRGWRETTIQEWQKRRPGQGARTDLL